MAFMRKDLLSFPAREKRRRAGRRIGLWFLLMVSLGAALFAGDTLYPERFNTTRGWLDAWSVPVVATVGRVLEPVRRMGQRLTGMMTLTEELERLRSENQELRGWKWRAGELESKLRDLRVLAKVVREPGVGFVTARVVSVSPGPLRNSVQINVGTKHGVFAGDAVINGAGLVGVISAVGTRSSWVRLVSDPDTRIDVVVGPNHAPSTMSGDVSGFATVNGWQAQNGLRAGDTVLTAGSLPGVPRGLRVGTLVRDGDRLRVSTHAQLERLDYLSVLLRPQAGAGQGIPASARGQAPGRSVTGLRSGPPKR